MTSSGILHVSQHSPVYHFVFEWLAYLVAGIIYRYQRVKTPIPIGFLDNLMLLSVTVFGAAAGGILMHTLESWSWYSQLPLSQLVAGKSILGAILGATIGTVIAKRIIGYPHPTGDAWVPALVAGMCIGRIGCQVSGTWDMTYGIPTEMGWGWNYGDGILRYPTALLEIIGVALTWLVLRKISWLPGNYFNAFLLAYCVLRFFIEFLKPPFGLAAEGTPPIDLFYGLTAIQWGSLFGIGWMGYRFRNSSLHRKLI